MSDRTANPDVESTALHLVYFEALRIHALTLIALGYARMKPSLFAVAEEDTITGELTKEMNAVLEDDAAPDWTQHYSVQEQVRANTPGKEGKARPIVDIEFERHKRGRRPRLRFEAKRLGPNHTAAGYFGDGGLEAFVTGYYDRTHNDAGMLAYMQSENGTTWAAKLAGACAQRSASLALLEPWAAFRVEGAPPNAYRTRHRGNTGLQLDVLHVLLQFS